MLSTFFKFSSWVRRPTRYDSVGSDDCRFIGIKECRRPFPSKRGRWYDAYK